MFRNTQPNFSRGEIGPQLYGRFDVDAYQAGLRKARNVLVLKYGGLTKRPGTRLVAEVVDATKASRLVPFQFSLTQTYALEMGQGYMSPCAMGGRLLEEELEISHITNAENARVTVRYHGLSVGDLYYIDGVEGEIGNLLNARAWRVIEIIDEDRFRINADTTDLAAFSGASGGIVRTGPPVEPVDPVVPDVVQPDKPPKYYYGGSGGFGGMDIP